jgi:hypothetical protein
LEPVDLERFLARDGVLSPGEAVHLLAGEHTAHEAL